MEQYLTPLSDEETQASYQAWISQLKAKKKAETAQDAA